jgi:hypothetical protein
LVLADGVSKTHTRKLLQALIRSNKVKAIPPPAGSPKKANFTFKLINTHRYKQFLEPVPSNATTTTTTTATTVNASA